MLLEIFWELFIDCKNMKLLIGASGGGLGSRVLLVATSHGRSHLRAGGFSQTISSPSSSSSSAGVSQTISSSLQSWEYGCDSWPADRGRGQSLREAPVECVPRSPLPVLQR